MELRPHDVGEVFALREVGRIAPTQNRSLLLLYILKSFASSPVCIRILFC